MRSLDPRAKFARFYIRARHAMPRTDLCLSTEALLTERPRCPQCGEEMWLVRLVPITPNTTERTFQCPVCDLFPFPAKATDTKQQA
jgi:hypothetical protein